MLSLDLFDSKFEKRLHEGAVDDAEYARLKKLGEKIDYLKQARAKTTDPEMRLAIDDRIDEYHNERLEILSVRGMNEVQQQLPPAKGLLKGKDLITPQQRVAGATPAKPGIMGAVKDVAGGVKRWLKGEPDQGPTLEGVNEQDNIEKFGPPAGSLEPPPEPTADTKQVNGQVILQALADAWDNKYPFVDLPFEPVTTVSRAKIYDILSALKKMPDAQFSRLIQDTFRDRTKFILWHSNLKRRPTPVEKPKTTPGQMKLFKEAGGQKKNSKSPSKVATPQNLAVQRYLQTVRKKHPGATSDLEAIAKDDMEQRTQTDQTIKDLKAVNRRQDAALKKAMSLDSQQGDEIDDIEKQLDQLSNKLQTIKTAKPVDGRLPGSQVVTPSRKTQPQDTSAQVKTVQPSAPDTVSTVDVLPAIDPDQLPAQDQEIYTQLQTLQQELDKKQNAGATNQQIQTLQQKIDSLSTQLSKSVGQLAGKTPKKSTKKSQIDLFPSIPDTGERRKSPRKEPEDLALAQQVLSRFKPQPVSAEVQEHGGGIGPSQRWQDLMPEGEMSNIDIMRQDLDLMNDVQFLRVHGISKEAFRQKYRTLLKPAPQQDMPVDEGWSDKYGGVMRPPTPYSVYIKGKKWKDFATDDHAQAVANKLKAKFKADGRDPETVTIAPTDMTEDLKKSAKAAALAACIATGGTLSGCATNPSVQGTIGTVRDVGTAVKTAKGMTRAGVQDELNQELRNFIRAQGGDPGSQNLSTLYKLQKKITKPQNETKEIRTKQDYYDAVDKIDREMKNETNPAIKQIKKSERDVLMRRAQAQGWIPNKTVNEIKDTPAVERAIIERLMVTDRPFMIKYGPEKVMGAAEDVAYNVGDVGAFGKDDVDSWVHQVKQILGATA